MKKEELLSEIANCAKMYDKALKDNNLLFIYLQKESNTLSFFNARFKAANYLHLTGVTYNGPASLFYKKCLNHKLSVNEIGFKNDGTTEQKLKILKNVVMIEKTAKMIGNYAGTGKISLYTEKIAGNTTGCLGFVSMPNNNEYVPNTALNQDIRDITAYPQSPVKAIFKKSIKEEKYNKLCYIAKKFDYNTLKGSPIISNLIDFEIMDSAYIEKFGYNPNITSQQTAPILPNEIPNIGGQSFGGQGFGGLS